MLLVGYTRNAAIRAGFVAQRQRVAVLVPPP